MEKSPYNQMGMADPAMAATLIPPAPIPPMPMANAIPPAPPVNVGMPGSTPVPTGVAQNLMSPVQAGGKMLSPINMNPGFEALPEDVQKKILKK